MHEDVPVYYPDSHNSNQNKTTNYTGRITILIHPYITPETLFSPLLYQEILYMGLILPSVPDMSHSKPGWKRSGRKVGGGVGVGLGRVIISVVMGPCTYFMVAPRVSSHSD